MYCAVSTLQTLQVQPGNVRYEFHMAVNLKMSVAWPVTAKHSYVTEEGSSLNQVHLRPLGIHRRRWVDNIKKYF